MAGPDGLEDARRRFIGQSAEDYDPAPPAVILGTTPQPATMIEAELPHLDTSQLDISELIRRLSVRGMSLTYQTARPFPHIVVDDVLQADVFGQAVREFPAMDDPIWNGYVHVNEMKYANAEPDRWGPTFRSIARVLTSNEFVNVLSELTGFEGLVPIGRWMVVDFIRRSVAGTSTSTQTSQPITATHLRRRVNLLLYFNEVWPPQWGGALELWDSSGSARSAASTRSAIACWCSRRPANAFHGHPDPFRYPKVSPDALLLSTTSRWKTDHSGAQLHTGHGQETARGEC